MPKNYTSTIVSNPCFSLDTLESSHKVNKRDMINHTCLNPIVTLIYNSSLYPNKKKYLKKKGDSKMGFNFNLPSSFRQGETTTLNFLEIGDNPLNVCSNIKLLLSP